MQVTNVVGTAVSNATALMVVQASSPPAIVTHPLTQNVNGGSSVTLSVVATGSSPLSYQWQKGGQNIAGATNSTFTLNSAGAGDSAAYTATVTNPNGSISSNAATVTVITLPVITTQPARSQVADGGAVSFTVVATSPAPLSYQWQKDGVALSGATGATYAIAVAQVGNAGTYTVLVSNSAGAVMSSAATLSVVPAGTTASHVVAGTGYISGGVVTISNTYTYSGTATSLGWQVLLPAGWSYASGSGSEGDVKPVVGSTSLAEWAWTNVPPSPVTFTYTLNVPAGQTGTKNVVAVGILRQGGTPLQIMAKADPLVISPVANHDADSDKDFRISLLELTRVIEIYNTRNGTVRTGAYAVATVTTEDGFVPDAARLNSASVTLTRYHSADTGRDGKLNLVELTRVIELYNYRAGTVRSGQYHVQGSPATEDGFAPGP